MQQQSLYLAVVHTAGHNCVATIQGVVKGMVERFLALSPQEAPHKYVKSVVLCFPDVPVAQAPELIDKVQFELKEEFVSRGLMLGEFHMVCIRLSVGDIIGWCRQITVQGSVIRPSSLYAHQYRALQSGTWSLQI